MDSNTYVIITKSEGKPLKIKASGQVISSDGKRVVFENAGKNIAIFNMDEIVGFVREDAMVN